MLCRAAFSIASLIVLAAAGYAQSQGVAALPEPCRIPISDTMEVLLKRQQSLAEEVATKTASMPAQDESRRSTPRQRLLKSQGQLLEVMQKIECLRSLEPVPPPHLEKRAIVKPAPRPTGVVEVTAYYATNRTRTGKSEADNFYGSKVDNALQYGRALVSIPLTHKVGELEMPTMWKFERTTDPKKHFVLKAVVPLKADDARKEMADKLAPLKSLLIFVHGYYTGFREAALRTAQLAHDLKFAGVPFFYSWPSANQLLGYLQDVETAELSERVFEQLLDDLAGFHHGDIYIVAHSMGTRIATKAVRARAEKGKVMSNLRELLLAAPDINADLFRTVIAPQLAAMQGTRTTVYASSGDFALRTSKAVNGFRRVGETIGGVLVYPGVETIDASSASLLLRSFGHSYVMDSASVLGDIQAIIKDKASAKQRRLGEAGTAPDTYWKLQ